MAVLAHVLSPQQMVAFLPGGSCVTLLLSTATVACLMHGDVKPPQLDCICEPKLLRGRISQRVEQGVFLHARNTVGP